MSSKAKRRHQAYLERRAKKKAVRDNQIKTDKIMREGSIEEYAAVLGLKLR